jgi:hypothetical protein
MGPNDRVPKLDYLQQESILQQSSEGMALWEV